MEDLINLHVDRFGVKPVIIGMFWHSPSRLQINIANAIENNKPYNERDLLSKEDLKAFDLGELVF